MRRRNLMIAAALVLGTGALGTAVAQGHGHDGGMGMRGGMMGGMGPGGMGGMMKGRGMMDPAARAEQRLARLKAEIKPTEKQEPLWQTFAEKSKAEANKAADSMRQRMGDDKPMTAPERLAQMQAGMKERLASMEAVNESFNKLYGALTPEQKAAADRHFSQMGRMQGPGRDGPGRGGQPASQPAADAHKH